MNNNQPGYVRTIYKLNVISEEWIFIGNLSHPTGDGWTVYSPEYNRIYLVGTHGGVIIFDLEDEGLIYDEDSMPIYVNKAPTVLVNNTIMVFGGIMDNSPNNAQFSSLVQMVDLPLISKPTQVSCDNKNDTWWIIVLSTGIAIICIIMGYIIGSSVVKAKRKAGNNRQNNMNQPLAINANHNDESYSQRLPKNTQGEIINK